MNDSPLLPSSFPETPRGPLQPLRRPLRPKAWPSGVKADHAPAQRPASLKAPETAPTRSRTHRSAVTQQIDNAPFIPFEVIDAPSQRSYVVAFYCVLIAWRLYERFTSDGLDATWLFVKWITVDGLFLFGLPILRIPWLEWAFSTNLAVYLLHVVANIFLMFNIPLPLGAWVTALAKLAYNRELAISGRSVKPYDILHNSSLILGRQTIQILPEGSAVLNPDRVPFCLASPRDSVTIPLRINQTSPMLIELVRFDLETGENETITVNAKRAKQLIKQAEKLPLARDANGSLDLQLSVRKTGVYRLRRVVDDSKLEVRRRPLDTLVVACPRARFLDSPEHRCKGQLSNVTLQVEGTPPLKVKYRRRRNDLDQGESIQSVQPEYLRSPLVSTLGSKLLITTETPELEWARKHQFQLALNETLASTGEWLYAVEEVHDACGNHVNYTAIREEQYRSSSKDCAQVHHFQVHERPIVSLQGCNAQSYLEAPKGRAVGLPVTFHSNGHQASQEGPYKITYAYSNDSQAGSASAELRDISMSQMHQQPLIREPGWYSLNSVSSKFCSGEVFEPSSCYLHNPPEPELHVRYEKLHDKCADVSVGLQLDLALLGTPPFQITYNIETSQGVMTKALTVDALRGELALTPSEAGHYRYEFVDISDSVYGPLSLKNKIPVLEQDVKPPASAEFVGRETLRACFGEKAIIDVLMHGEGPWTLDYEIVHKGKRVRGELESDTPHDFMTTDALTDGGDYVVALTGIKDKTNCKRPLKEQMTISVRPRRPRVAFGEIDKKRSVWALEDRPVGLPIRLEGVAPFIVKIKNVHDDAAPVIERVLRTENSAVEVQKEGLYEIVSIVDASCPGSIDQKAKAFEVKWIPRPRVTAVDGKAIGGRPHIVKPEVCEGDEQVLELGLGGHPPYLLRYEEQCRPLQGSPAVRTQSLEPAMNAASIGLDTSRAGNYTYKFTGLGDNLYHMGKRSQTLLTVQQQVNPRPSARFELPGHSYGFCKEGSEAEEVIPVVLDGLAPFSLEIAIKHPSNPKPDLISIPRIDTTSYLLPIPRRYLHLGQQEVIIHSIRDARGCQRVTGSEGSPVKVVVSDVPSIIPLEAQEHFCVGEHISFSLSGHAPFNVYYEFNDVARTARLPNTIFRRIAEQPGTFTITGVSDSASGKCRAQTEITKFVHAMPSVRISHGTNAFAEIHEGGEVDIVFEFWGTPPFEFTYIRSSIAVKGRKSEILETRQDISYEHMKIIRASDEGTYEVVAIKDKYCSFSIQDTGRHGKNR
ncbi:hypothetical protein KEM52_006327 [Ascosphaera acerosa]|nr:hypothetical protein KEM52_006327 [Ascosphaera acerosa]